ncbi:DNA-directed RNA polymerase II subunit A [Sesbania bispinosa]|nr:DNA-directed RNA polymerase II subunit A [Sesbania bispinosa]
MDIELNSGTNHNPIGLGVQHVSNMYSVDGLNAQFAFGPDTQHVNLSHAVDVVGAHLDETKTQNEVFKFQLYRELLES